MKSYTLVTLLLLGLLSACNKPSTVIQALLGEQSPRDTYVRTLRKQGMLETEAVQQWLHAGETALRDSLIVSLPFREDGVFPAGGQRVFTYQFTLPAGRRLEVQLNSTDSLYFLDLFQLRENASPQRLAYISEKNRILRWEATDDTPLLIRLQPQLSQPEGEFSLRLRTEPLLAFPVAGRSAQHIISFWGAARDGGARSHEGIDVIAPRGTPLLASVPGYITRTGTNPLGGNVVHLSADGLNLSLYYAHLDQQLVQSGQRVRAGDTLGTVGNTGNAITTAPHLHFGIYRSGGAVDPLPYVQAPEFPAATVSKRSADTLRTREATALFSSLPPSRTTRQRLPRHAIVWVEAATKGYFRVQTPEGQRGYVLASSIQPTDKRLSRRKLTTMGIFRENLTEAVADTLPKGTTIDVLGTAAAHEFIRLSDGRRGWIPTISDVKTL